MIADTITAKKPSSIAFNSKSESEIENDTVFNGLRQLSVKDIRQHIPGHFFIKSEARFLVSVFFSVSLTLCIGCIAHCIIPVSLAALPLWILYALVNGTVATGIWVLGHECGHHAFSSNPLANEILGFILHTSVLVPYFSWQWSHHVHHMKCNHLTEGETHVPRTDKDPKSAWYLKFRDIIGVESFAIWQLLNITIIGWPAYLIFGTTGGPGRGFTSHFIVPNGLFQKDKMLKVQFSNIGIAVVVYLLYIWGKQTSFWYILGIYVGPYLIINAWVTFITFLQHTEDQVPHYDSTTWSWLRGALCTVDRNYPEFINALQHDIGSTHVLHHIFHEMPCYHAREANIYLKEILGPVYFHDKKSIKQAAIDAGKLVCVTENQKGFYYWI